MESQCPDDTTAHVRMHFVTLRGPFAFVFLLRCKCSGGWALWVRNISDKQLFRGRTYKVTINRMLHSFEVQSPQKNYE